ncbi:concanavalin A-like lectin/glucanase domain-containing protein [Mariannaea sp. PMI_226]|nr:concanavalin A-like lectin/glucanase domain-containing protein [Mariannaea sp. PMI_226]
MSHHVIFAVALYLFSSVLALNPPSYSGFNLVWSDRFDGRADSRPSDDSWVIITGDHNFNNEWQTYTRNSRNLRMSGKGTLQLIPQADRFTSGGWTSARIESKHLVKPIYGRITRVQASLRLAGNPKDRKQGIWPAFWLLGDTYRHGVLWPASGEIDIMENLNGQSTVYGVAHCDRAPGGTCNEFTGLAGTTYLPDHRFHSFRVDFDRRSRNWRRHSVTWYRDGQEFNRITGAQVGNPRVWKTLCQNSMYIILNVAVGGNLPGGPNSRTLGGSGSMMEVQYVAHYVSR